MIGRTNCTAAKVKIPLWKDASFEEIENVLNDYYSGIIDLETIMGFWHVGDEKKVILKKIQSVDRFIEQPEQEITLRIIDFDHDELSDGSGKALLSIELSDTLLKRSYYTYNGLFWSDCELRSYLNSSFFDALPDKLKELIKTVNKYTARVTPPKGIIAKTEDKVFILSVKEMNQIPSQYELSFEEEGNVYEFYKEKDRNRYFKLNSISEYGASVAYSRYFLRSAYSTNVQSLFIIIFTIKVGDIKLSLGEIYNYSYPVFISPSFCL